MSINKANEKEPLAMKYSKTNVHCKSYAIQRLHFEDQGLPSYSGLIIFQKIFTVLELKHTLAGVSRT